MDPNNLNSPVHQLDATASSAQAGDKFPPITVPDHELLKPIGKGSYGTVWLARHAIGVYRAVKIVYRKSFADDRPYERELSGIKKFEPISRSHEGFVDVLHVGISGSDCFYYVMELGDEQDAGQNFDPASYTPKTLNKEISLRGRLSFQECLELGIALSDALGALHKHGLVHRDVKPSNIIFVNGVPKLADIGLVAGVDETRSYVGTQGFIPPEGPGTLQADIYGLGKVLYEASSGKDRQEFPDLPTELDALKDREGFLELNEVILQACRNDISKRYQSAWDMHSDLLVIAKGKSVKRLKALEKQVAYTKRVAGISALVIALASAVGYPLYLQQRTAAAARQQQVGMRVAYGNGALETGDKLGALADFAEAIRLERGNAGEQTAQRLRFGATIAQCPKLIRVWSLATDITDCRISPDNKQVLICQQRGGVRICDLLTGEACAPLFAKTFFSDCGQFSPDGRFVVTAGQYSPVTVWNRSDLKPADRWQFPEGALSAQFSPDGKLVAGACVDKLIRIWQAGAETQEPILILTGHNDAVTFAIFSHDGNYIASASQDGTAQLWNAKTGQPIGKPFKHDSWVNYVAFSPDDKKIVTACSDYRARVWDIATHEQISAKMSHNDPVQSVEYSPDGRLILTASLDGTARIWSADNGAPPQANLVMRHPSGVRHASFNSDGNYVVTACFDGTVCVWDLAGCTVPPIPKQEYFCTNGSRSLTLTNNTISVFDAGSRKELSHWNAPGLRPKNTRLNRNGRFVLGIVTHDTNFEFKVWEASSGKVMGPQISIAGAFAGASLSDDGSKLATWGLMTAQIWDISAAKALSPPLKQTNTIDFALFNPKGDLMVIVSSNLLSVWNATNGQPVLAPQAHPSKLTCAAFSPDGKYLATCCKDDLLTKYFTQVWEVAIGRPVGRKLWHGDGVLFADFSPDSKRVVTAGEDHNALIWDVLTGKRLTRPLKHLSKVFTAMFSPDGAWIVTACEDGTVRVWSAETGEPLTPSFKNLNAIRSAMFLPGGHRVVAVGRDGNSSIWDLSVDNRPIEDLRRFANLLSPEISSTAESSGNSAANSPETVWKRLRDRYPDTFTTTVEQNAAWQEFEADESEAEGQWSAALFHLQRLSARHPGDASFAARFAKAQDRVNEAGH